MYTSEADKKTVRLTRAWTDADELGTMHALAYLVVFRPVDAPAPSVSDIQLQTDADGISAAAKVEGQDLSVSFKD